MVGTRQEIQPESRASSLDVPFVSKRMVPRDSRLQTLREEILEAISSEGENEINPERLAELAFEWACALSRFVLRSDQGTPKSEKLLQLLSQLELPGGINRNPLLHKIIYAKESPVEDVYHALPGIKGQPKYVALLKASASHTLPIPNRVERARALRQYANQFDEIAEGQEPPSRGVLTVFRATDIMTEISTDEGVVGLFKPPQAVRKETNVSKQKIQTYHHAIQQFGDSENGKELKEMVCVAAEAQYEGLTNLGVVHESRINIKMSVPTQAFWWCYFWGTSDVRPAFQNMATRFNNIYAETIKLKRQDLLRDWTPQEGASGAHKVNGGFQTDIIFARRLLYKSIQDGDDGEIVCPGNPAFDQICDKAAFLWRGEPLMFQDVLRDLVQLIYRESTGAHLPDDSFNNELRELRDTMRRHFQWQLPFADRLADGVWFEGSTQRTPTSVEDVRKLLDPHFERRMSKTIRLTQFRSGQ